MSITMSMNSDEIEHDSMETEYGDDILYAGWNPEVESVCQQLHLVTTNERRNMPVALTTEVAELFLRKMYSYQR